MIYKTLTIIPTYNESKSICHLIQSIINLNCTNLLIIDDNSPDSTSNIVKEFISTNDLYSQIFIIDRNVKSGLGSAYIVGFKYALENNYDKIIQIDADLSHNPKDIPQLINESNNYDLIIGSRYINGIRIMNWPISRLFLSYFANIYSKIITGIPVHDLTGGYKCINTTIFRTINLDNIKSEGYSFQIEINFLVFSIN